MWMGVAHRAIASNLKLPADRQRWAGWRTIELVARKAGSGVGETVRGPLDGLWWMILGVARLYCLGLIGVFLPILHAAITGGNFGRRDLGSRHLIRGVAGVRIGTRPGEIVR